MYVLVLAFMGMHYSPPPWFTTGGYIEQFHDFEVEKRFTPIPDPFLTSLCLIPLKGFQDQLCHRLSVKFRSVYEKNLLSLTCIFSIFFSYIYKKVCTYNASINYIWNGDRTKYSTNIHTNIMHLLFSDAV